MLKTLTTISRSAQSALMTVLATGTLALSVGLGMPAQAAEIEDLKSRLAALEQRLEAPTATEQRAEPRVNPVDRLAKPPVRNLSSLKGIGNGFAHWEQYWERRVREGH